MTLSSDHLAEITDAAELTRVLGWLDDIALINSSTVKKHAVEIVAARHQCSVRSVWNHVHGVRDHGPLYLLDGRRGTHAITPALYGHRSPAFREWVRGLYYGAKRANATPTVYGQMIARLHAWRAHPHDPSLVIPGYASPPLDSPESRYQHPKGWSQRNLQQIAPDAYNHALGTRGRQAANALLAPVLTTRVGLHVGEVYMIDDQFYDLKVQYGSKMVRPVGLNVLDLFSGCDVLRGIRPELPDNPDGEKSLSRRDTIWLAVLTLTTIGFYRERCRFDLESGTSTFSREFIENLELVTDRRVTVKIHNPSYELVKGVLAPSKGNPRAKASRESWFNILRNRMSSLPLALGKGKDYLPEDTPRLESEANALLKIAETRLSPAEISDLRLDFGLSWHGFFSLANRISEVVINQRTDHDLEGWAALGFEVPEFFYGGEWIGKDEYLDLPGETRALLTLRADRGEIVSRLRKLSPREVHTTGLPKLQKISPFRWNILLPHDLAIPRTIPPNGAVKIDRREYGPEPLVFQPFSFDEQGQQLPLKRGQDVLIFFNPFLPQFALFTDTHGRNIGLVFTVEKGTRLDEAALLAQYTSRGFDKAHIGASAEHYNDRIADENKARRAHNQSVIEAAGVKPKNPRPKTKPAPSATVEILPPADDTIEPPLTLSPPAEDDTELGLF